MSYIAPYSSAISRTDNGKMSDIVSTFDFIPLSLQAAIRAGTSTTDVSSYLTAMHAAVPAGVTFLFPSGQYNIGAGSVALTGRLISTAGVTFTGGGSITGALYAFPLSLEYGGLGGSQAAATANQIPVFPGAGAAASPTSATALLDQAFGSAQGMVLYRGASAWAALSPGTAGYPLLTGGAAANPSYNIIGLAAGGLGGSQAAATAGQVPIYPGSGGAAVPTSLPTLGTGTTTNDNAAAGFVGEYISSSIPAGSAVSLTDGAATNVTSVSLTAGDWDCRGNTIGISAGSTVRSAFYTWTSTTSATFPTLPNGGSYVQLVVTTSAGATTGLALTSARYSLSGTTTVYLSVISNFSISTDSAIGFIGCRRVR